MRWTFVFILLFGLSLAHQPTKGKPKKDKIHAEKTPSLKDPTLIPVNVTEDLSAVDVSNMNSDFGFNLYRRTADKHDNNIFFSPFSISFLLGALALGARGKTHNEMLTGLGWGPFKKQKNPDLLPALLKDLKEGIMKSEGYSLDLGSLSLLHEKFSVNQEFLNQTLMYFNMEFQSVNFHDRHVIETIRDLIRTKTKGRISELQDDIDPQTKMMLLDFILFKGKWKTPFKPKSTITDTFYVNKYSLVNVPMMYKTDKVASMFDKSMSCTVLDLPYRGGAHMLVVMPENDGNFDALEDGLSSELVASWLNKMEIRKTDVFFPKFQLDHKYKLKSSLEELGIKDVFTGRANFTGMTEERDLMLSEITQRAVIDIDEFGTEATAISGAEIIGYSLPHTIRINHPFIFLIFSEKFQSLLFIGRVSDPTKH
ncbi:protein Z-dependent protease inhibitor [Mantella aurantiaca]